MAARLEVRRNFFSNRVIDSWNQIPSEQRHAWIQNLQSQTGTSHIKEYESGDETVKWRGQLNTDTY
jgi:hypothetical protein